MIGNKIGPCASCDGVFCASYGDDFRERTSHDDLLTYALCGGPFHASCGTYGGAFCAVLFYVSYASYETVRDVQASCKAIPLRALASHGGVHGVCVGSALFETYRGKISYVGFHLLGIHPRFH